jgi:SNF2 family DNA or RNA helicase
MRVISFHGILQERERLKKANFTPGTFDVCVTTYDILKAEETFFQRNFMWGYLILDEGKFFICGNF